LPGSRQAFDPIGNRTAFGARHLCRGGGFDASALLPDFLKFEDIFNFFRLHFAAGSS
jgi:hypothetical protein